MNNVLLSDIALDSSTWCATKFYSKMPNLALSTLTAPQSTALENTDREKNLNLVQSTYNICFERWTEEQLRTCWIGVLRRGSKKLHSQELRATQAKVSFCIGGKGKGRVCVNVRCEANTGASCHISEGGWAVNKKKSVACAGMKLVPKTAQNRQRVFLSISFSFLFLSSFPLSHIHSFIHLEFSFNRNRQTTPRLLITIIILSHPIEWLCDPQPTHIYSPRSRLALLAINLIYSLLKLAQLETNSAKNDFHLNHFHPVSFNAPIFVLHLVSRHGHGHSLVLWVCLSAGTFLLPLTIHPMGDRPQRGDWKAEYHSSHTHTSAIHLLQQVYALTETEGFLLLITTPFCSSQWQPITTTSEKRPQKRKGRAQNKKNRKLKIKKRRRHDENSAKIGHERLPYSRDCWLIFSSITYTLLQDSNADLLKTHAYSLDAALER